MPFAAGTGGHRVCPEQSPDILVAKSQHSHTRFMITHRNKPVAALVSLEDLQLLEQHEEKRGVASIDGRWESFDEVEAVMGDLATLRSNDGA